MARYIDADELITNIEASIVLRQAITEIENMPTADVQPVIHAKWIMRGGKFRCSNCDALSPLTKGWEDGCRTYTHTKTKFCSECGADMREVEQ